MKSVIVVAVWLGSSTLFSIAAGLAFQYVWPGLLTNDACPIAMIVSMLFLVFAVASAGLYFEVREKP